MNDSINYGISGVEQITAENLAVGNQSRIEQHNLDRSLTEALVVLRESIEQADASPDTRRALVEARDEIERELRAPTPDKQRVLSKLAWMSQVAGPAGALLQATTALAQLAGSLL